MVKLEFNKDYAVYKKGDTANVNSYLAALLIKKGVAKEYKRAKKSK